MGQFIHRNGDRYRVWSTEWDKYVTEPMTRAEMERHLREQAASDAAQEIAERLGRADAQGTSLRFETRDADSWDEEVCDECGAFHHALGENCCDDEPDHPGHGPRCKGGV